ncbi:MAG: glycerol-3-phosphate 1-O-acyltransferase PlsY [Bacilli bacterium]|nr:glycerol-3-phosphate 1-O-acyltransferase PlsY [Bacilli bacterium]
MNPLTINILVGVAAIVLGYLFGSIPTGVLVGKIFFHIDPREVGSHNSGGTNVARTMGRGVGIAVIILDMFKTIIPVLIVWAVLTFSGLSEHMNWGVAVGNATIGGAKVWYWAAGLAAALGHCWPLYIHFKGGKAVACFMGLNILTSWIEVLTAGITYLVVATKSRFISLASIVTAIVGSVVAWIIFILQVSIPWDITWLQWNFHFGLFPVYGFEFAVVDTIIAVLLIVRHRANIARLRAGTESKNPFMKSE